MDEVTALASLDLGGDSLGDETAGQLLRIAQPRLRAALRQIERPPARAGIAATALGRLLVAEGARGLMAVMFLDRPDAAANITALRRRLELAEDAKLAAAVSAEIDRYLGGELDALSGRKIDLSLVPGDFQRRALTRLRKLSPGTVMTYQSLGAAIGAPSGQRAIGNSMASNPIPVYVPCHRVIRADGSIGNYGGGAERKLKLLRAEGFHLDGATRVADEAVYGHWVSRIFCRAACPAVRRAKERRWIIFADAARARALGMRACKICHPG